MIHSLFNFDSTSVSVLVNSEPFYQARQVIAAPNQNKFKYFYLFQCVFSSGKTVSSIIVAKLVEQNLLSYKDKIVQYWPNFANNENPEKAEITIADVLRHESGLSWINHTFAKDDFLLENIKKNKVGQILEKEPLHMPGFGGDQNTPTNR